MKLAMLFAGQGSQCAGMGKDLYEGNATFQKTFDAVTKDLDFDAKTDCFSDPEGRLNQTEYTQPCMIAFQVALTEALKEKGILDQVDYVAGLSLGEYAALAASGLWSPEDAVKIAAFRGRAMAKAAEGVDCGMAAVLGLEREDLEPLLEEHTYITNDNCPGQMVISGEKTGVEKTAAKAKEAGAMRVIPLKVSGPFHTPYMSPAGDALHVFLKETPTQDMQIPVVYNFLGKPESDADVAFLLEKQVQFGVRMRESLEYLLSHGVDTFLEVGPGNALSGFVKRTAKAMEKGVTLYHVQSLEELEGLAL